MIGLELRDRVRDDGQDAATSGRAAGVRADRVHVAEHRVQAFVGDVPHPIDLIGEPGKPAGEGGREHEDRSRRVDDRAHRRWQLTDVSDGGVGDEQQPLDRRSAVRQVGREFCEVQDCSRLSPCVSTFGSIGGRRGRGPCVS